MVRPIQAFGATLMKDIYLRENGVDWDNGFSIFPTVDSFLNQYRTWNEFDLKAEMVRISQIAESRNLYEKANSGAISQAERKDLAQIIRISTALHCLVGDLDSAGI